MAKKQMNTRNPEDDENENEAENEKPLKEGGDICQQLLDRYSKSSAPQHRHLLATAGAMRSIISAESLPLSPPAYFAAAISAIESSQSLDPTATEALLTFLSIVIQMILKHGITYDKAEKAVEVLAGVMEKEDLSAASTRSAVKCLGLLLVGFCNLGDWGSVQLGFQELLKFSVDKRPKVPSSISYPSMSCVDISANGPDNYNNVLSNFPCLIASFVIEGTEVLSRVSGECF